MKGAARSRRGAAIGISHVGVIGDLEESSFGKSVIGVDLGQNGNGELTHSMFRQLFQYILVSRGEKK